MRVVVAGSSGLIGTALVAHLREAGHEVRRLVRRAPAAPDERGWDPPAGRVDDGTFDGVDAVVNLGGVGIGDRPWSGARRQMVRDSRNVPTEVLATAVADHRVPAFLSASAVGYYGDTGGRAVDESAPSGTGFLAEVCRDWEAATRKAQDAGARVALLRSGVVLSPAGGLLGRLRPLFAAFLGARLGSGRQYLSWISLDDEVGAIRYVLEHPELAGPVNLTAPTPVTNAEFTKALASAVGRPAPFLAVPEFALQRTLGAMGEEMLLYGQRAVPAKLQAAGYPFRHIGLGEALSAAVGR
ncbi:TIGR01777 family oxidoreductase [Pseudonocardia nigra]|uniref:TIGR01777 family oxidoreductase n=1 Tax=Pseudonocardia nigra TaxID=1921578 RepID=UPI001C5CD099|nr:TIGR01777 family oxidoreductase [Pseudonocardia nigra]